MRAYLSLSLLAFSALACAAGESSGGGTTPPPPDAGSDQSSLPDTHESETAFDGSAGADSQADVSLDAEPDAEPDASPDSEPDVSLDSEPEVGPDVGPDVSPDSEPEVGPDVGPDVSPDVGPDAEACVPGQWQFGVIETAGDTGSHVSLKMDGTGALHATYHYVNGTMSADLRYAVRPPSSDWATYSVDHSGNVDHPVGLYSSLALGPGGVLHASYYDSYDLDLKVAHHDPAQAPYTWEIDTVDTTGNVGKHSSLGVDSTGGLHVGYQESILPDAGGLTGRLKYAHRPAAGSWTTAVVDESADVGEFCSLGVDSSGGIHVLYTDADAWDVKAADRPSAAGWSISTVDTGDVGMYISLALDPSDGLHATYLDHGSMTIRYAHRPDTGSWSFETVGAGTGPTSLALGSDGRLYVGYRTLGNALSVAERSTGGQWTSETLNETATQTGEHLSLGVDSSHGLHVVYYGTYSVDDDFLYAHRCP